MEVEEGNYISLVSSDGGKTICIAKHYDSFNPLIWVNDDVRCNLGVKMGDKVQVKKVQGEIKDGDQMEVEEVYNQEYTGTEEEQKTFQRSIVAYFNKVINRPISEGEVFSIDRVEGNT